MRYEPGLNQQVALRSRMGAAFDGAQRVHIAAAYAKSSGTSKLLRLRPPRGSRAVVWLGFGISDPPGYIGITNGDWWELRLHLRDQTDRALCWRRNTKGFKALATGAVFLSTS